jgi:tryptophan synthase alpha subunit
VARKGVTGAKTSFASLDRYLARCRQATVLPLAVGFGVKERADVDQLVDKADIAVVGSETIRVIEEQGGRSGRPIPSKSQALTVGLGFESRGFFWLAWLRHNPARLPEMS